MLDEIALSAPLAPTRIAPGTYLIREVQHALGQPLSVYINSMVILGSEPIIVDTGSAKHRNQWLDAVFGLVEPTDVRWIFLSHEDADHTGNLAEVLTACPNATLVCSWALVERAANFFDFPLPRCHWLNDGDRLGVGDREIVALRPPVYDSPTTRGLFDTKSRVYWAVDSFATPVPGGAGTAPMEDLLDLDPTEWWNGLVMFGLHAVSPWLTIADTTRYAGSVKRLRRLDITTLAGGHTPAIPGAKVDEAFEMIGRLAGLEAPPCPDQSVLEFLIAAMDGDGTLAGANG